MSTSTRLQLPYLAAGQAQKHVTVNEALRRLDALVNCAVKSAMTTAQPGSPSDGDLYILPPGKTGAAWGAMSNYAIAYYRDGVWEQISPLDGWLAFVTDSASWLFYAAGAWSSLSASSIGARPKLTANRTYYVRTDGSDSNNGLANTSGGGFLTLQKAWDEAVKIDLGGFAVTIQMGDGTYTGGLNAAVPPVGGNIAIVGNTATPGNVVISKTSGDAIALSCVARLSVSGVKVATTTSGNGICCGAAGGQILLGAGMQFGACAGNHIYAEQGGYVSSFSAYTINGGAACHIQAQRGGGIDMFGQTVTLSGAPAFSTAFALGRLIVQSITYSGSAAGVRYLAATNGVISTNGGGASFFPGNSAGSTSTGGQYV